MLLSVSNVRKGFGAEQILHGVTFRLDQREKVALVGRNGSGKTTLLRIITGQMAPDTGTVFLRRGAKVGYLRQEAPVTIGRSVLEEAQAAVETQLELKTRLEELEAKMDAGTSTEDDLEEYALLHEHSAEAESYSVETDVRTVLLKMGFTEDEFDKPTELLSGGERTRLAIARLLLEEPDLLILDEPTNHLDLQATEWLENWLRGYHGAVLLVSHDRAFLDNTAERVLEMDGGTVLAYPGPFEKYLELKRLDEERRTEVARQQKIEIAKMDEFVRRFMNSQRTAQARGRQKLLNRLIENKVEAPKDAKGIRGGFTKVARSGDQVIVSKELTIGFEPDVVLFKGLDWNVNIGERWGVIGENGAGKSTLIKVLLGELAALKGSITIGANVTPGYFSQDASDLDPEKTPFETMIWDMDMEPQPARDLLGKFLFSGDDVMKKVSNLSGGEKNKLSLAMLTQLNPNLLILDEPTNHLDMDSREALAGILNQYKGTLVLISHDRWLLTKVTTQTLDIRKAGPIVYPAPYPEYRNWVARGSITSKSKVSGMVAVAVAEPTMSPRELSKEIQRIEKLVSTHETQIGGLETELLDIEAKLANPKGDILEMSKRHGKAQQELAHTLSLWESESVRLEELRAMQGA